MPNTTQNTQGTKNIEAPHYLMWFRRDLRIHDNTAFAALCELVNNNKVSDKVPEVSAIFFITPSQWLQHNMALVQVDLVLRTLPKLAKLLHTQFNIKLHVQVEQTFGNCNQQIAEFCNKQHITHVFANHEYELNEIIRDEAITHTLKHDDATFNLYHDQCILPPQSIQTKDGRMYQVFTPFYKQWLRTLDAATSENIEDSNLELQTPTLSLAQNQKLNGNQENETELITLCNKVLDDYKKQWITRVTNTIGNSNLLIETDRLLENARQKFPAGEVNACHRLDEFLGEDVHKYDTARDVPSLDATSKLSPYLAIGSISPRLCYLQAVKTLNVTKNITDKTHDLIVNEKPTSTDVMRWISELAWRDFYRHVLVEKPNLIKHEAYHTAVDAKVSWSYNQQDFAKWCTGQTGYPIVDAAMRSLNVTGYMHNRLRMVVAMFLTKDLLIDWRWGERFFMQTLIDGDFASNNGGWQWSASTGTDAAPYFRIMNPFSQSKTHDTQAIFIKTWLPELKYVDAKILHDETKLRQFLDSNPNTKYPAPMVYHKQARLITIEQFKSS